MTGKRDGCPRRHAVALVTAALIVSAVLAVIPDAKSEIIRLSCGKTALTIDTAKPSVVLRYTNGFSQAYENSAKTSSYEFLDGTKSSYTSDMSVAVTDQEVRFSDRYQSATGLNVIGNVIDRKTGLWRSDQNGHVATTPCVKSANQ
jgi:hypothetical protein